jgi:hypothetical protein
LKSSENVENIDARAKMAKVQLRKTHHNDHHALDWVYRQVCLNPICREAAIAKSAVPTTFSGQSKKSDPFFHANHRPDPNDAAFAGYFEGETHLSGVSAAMSRGFRVVFG